MFNRISEHLCKQDLVQECFWLSHIRLAHQLLPESVEIETVEEPPWNQLLAWASTMSQSDSPHHVELALIATIAAMLTAETNRDEISIAAEFILQNFSNSPTINLAKRRGVLKQDVKAVTVSAIIRQYQRQLQHFIYDDADNSIMPVTDFQERIWDALDKPEDTALSAPTSAGKSYILIRWLVSMVLSCAPNDILVYVVPSRALISQVRSHLTELLLQYSIRPRIITLPTVFIDNAERQTILVMTQERVERLFAVNQQIAPKVFVVDEAHKLGAGPRGVVLQRVIDEALYRNSSCRVIMAAPHAENAEELLPRLIESNSNSNKAITDSRPTVLQNLYWVDPIPRRGGRWKLTLVRDGKAREIGQCMLHSRPPGKKRKLAALALELGGTQGGNIIFTNGPGEAEEVGLLLSDFIQQPEGQTVVDEEVIDLARLIKESVHKSYPLGETLSAGVGVHYGDMPEICRREQERLFDSGKLPFLVCTSTLLEGVNLPCRNLFIWGPKTGKSASTHKMRPMDEHTFWNLAGRAGRWGREFAGNIFCIDVYNPKDWPYGPPKNRYAQRVKHSGTELIGNLDKFEEFLETDNVIASSQSSRYLEQIFGELVAARLLGKDILSLGWAKSCSTDQLERIGNLIDGQMDKITAPKDVLLRNRGINPILISNFIEQLKLVSQDEADHLMPAAPDMSDASIVLSQNLKSCNDYLGSDFGNSSQINLISNATIAWIRGTPLGKILSDRVNYRVRRDPKAKVPRVIRDMIKLINVNSRFKIPKYLSCYSDCVRYWYSHIGRMDLHEEVSELQDILESGVSGKTMISLVALGFTRMSAIEISNNIAIADMTIDEVVEWLEGHNLEARSISPVIIREVERTLEAARFSLAS